MMKTLLLVLIGVSLLSLTSFENVYAIKTINDGHGNSGDNSNDQGGNSDDGSGNNNDNGQSGDDHGQNGEDHGNNCGGNCGQNDGDGGNGGGENGNGDDNNDDIPPEVTPPPDQEVSTTSSSGKIVNFPRITATDNIRVTSGPTCTPPSTSKFPVGTTIVKCIASDAAGNVGSATFTVTVKYTPTTTHTPNPTTTPPRWSLFSPSISQQPHSESQQTQKNAEAQQNTYTIDFNDLQKSSNDILKSLILFFEHMFNLS